MLFSGFLDEKGRLMRKTFCAEREAGIFNEIPLFSCLGENEIALLEAAAIQKTYPKNAFIINEGDETDWLYVVLKGRSNAISIDPNGRQIVLNVFEPGDYFGELSLIDDKPRCASVITKEPSKFSIIKKNAFDKIASSNPDLMNNMMKGLVKKIRRATKQIEDLAFRDVYGRIARLLVELKNEDGMIAEKLTNQEIAFRIGSSREMASRIMTELKNGKYIVKCKGGFIKMNKKLPYTF